MTTILLKPTYPIPNRDSQIIVTGSGSGTNFFRVWATVAPTGSSLDNKIKDASDPRNRYEIYANGGGEDFPLTYKFDKGGKYTLIIQEYIKGSGYGGGYEGDPDGSNQEEKNGPESTVFVYIGQKLTQSIGPADSRATLNLWVWDNTIRATYKSIHGEDTPSITATPLTDRIKSAIESTAVKLALLDLVNKSTATIIGDMHGLVLGYLYTWNAHLSDSTYHVDSDSVNLIDTSLDSAYTLNTLKDFVNSALIKQKHHFSNDNSFDITATPPIGPSFGNYHSSSDRPNMSIYDSVGSLDEAYGAMVDLYRCYELHRLSTGVHPTNDVVNDLGTLPELMAVHSAYLSIISSPNPTPPAAQSTGAQNLIFKVGFKEV